ncbi:MAG: MSHA biogenesis protein MshP [Colwellia sp.]|nr:MSHA biogenesis protein MshP [Colwellia sp.]
MAIYFNKLIKIKSPKSQQGSALMLAIFVIVIILLLGLTLVEILSTGNEAVSQEVLGTRAFTAANSGMQGQLQILFPLGGGEGPCPASLPPLEPIEYSFIGVDGLSQCKAFVTCDNYAEVNGIKYYRLESTGQCGTGVMDVNSRSIVLSSRTVIVEARGL